MAMEMGGEIDKQNSQIDRITDKVINTIYSEHKSICLILFWLDELIWLIKSNILTKGLII